VPFVPDTFSSSQRNLLGENPEPDLVRKLSNEKQVTGKNPPTFIWHTGDDAVVAVENSIAFCSALHQAGVPAELHVYKTGRGRKGVRNRFGKNSFSVPDTFCCPRQDR
jgi:dipeptidyl aminopeptidase/acylaminoacyl peptidase